MARSLYYEQTRNMKAVHGRGSASFTALSATRSYFDFNREERHLAAVLFHLLCLVALLRESPEVWTSPCPGQTYPRA